MNKLKGSSSYQIESISQFTKIIKAGKDLEQKKALEIAFPDAKKYESFGFTIIGNDLQIRRYHFN
ncbi:MAG: hypothetical protein DRO88_01465 [Promethearchaeia archaeon]|nr:MAG: hypothetical protein DRO88_01465 [Candidatus Lokiarchaeia archaeon]